MATATSDNAAADLDPNLQDQLRAALAAAVATQTATSGLRVISGTPQEQLRQMSELARPATEHVRAVEQLMVQVTRGQMPLGVLARAVGRPYAQAVVEHVAGVLCAEGNQTEHSMGVTDALGVLGVEPVVSESGERISVLGTTGGLRLLSVAAVPVAEVVIDASALFVRGLLPTVDPQLIAGIREFVLADDAYIDLIAARDRLMMDTVGVLHVDPHTGQAGFRPVDPRIQQLNRDSLATMITLAASCRRRTTPTSSHPDLDALQIDGDAQVSGLRLAAARQAALWVDDVAVRQLARMVGISTFSTAALLEACVRIGRLTQPECEAAIEALIRGNVGDFAPNLPRARRFVAERGDTRGAMLGAMAKPAFWSDSPAAMEVYAALLTDLQMSDRPVVPDLVYVSVIGICRTGLPDTRAIEVISGVLAHALITVGGDFGDVRPCCQPRGWPLRMVDDRWLTFCRMPRSQCSGPTKIRFLRRSPLGGGQGHDSSRHLGTALISSSRVGVARRCFGFPPIAQHAHGCGGRRRDRRLDRTRVQ